MTETLREIFKRDPREALEEHFRRERERLPYMREDKIFCWVSVMGNHGQYRYGKYRDVTRQELEGRQYDIEYSDSGVAIFFTDVVHDPLTYKNVPKEVK